MAADANAGKDVRTHEETYGFFTGLMKWGTIVSAIVAMIVVFIIAS